MKFTAIILLSACVAASAKGYSQITLSAKDAPLEKLFTEIRKQTGFYFFYDIQELKAAKPVTIKVKDAGLEETLNKCFLNQPLTYSIINNTIVVKQKEAAPANEEKDLTTPPIDLRGKVIDEEGLPLPGASVMLKRLNENDSKIGTIADSKGTFQLDADERDSLVVSLIGYATRRFLVKDLGNPFTITLKVAVSTLDIVQIIGYGTTTQRLTTGSQVKLSAKEIAKRPVSNILLAMQGQIAGMQISQNFSGIIGNAPTVKIRGTNSIAAGTSPLFILDGIPIPEKQLSQGGGVLNGNLSSLLSLNPADIESIEVLKDADATAIYGSRGANGVVLITSKKGKAGRTTIDFNSYTGFSELGHRIDLKDVHQYNAMRREALKNDNITPTVANAPDLLAWDSTKVYDWQKLLLGRKAITTDVNFSVSGGNDNTTFYINGGYHREGTVFPTGSNYSGDTRKSLRFSINNKTPDKKFEIGLIGGYSNNELSLPPQDMTSFINMPPQYPLYTVTGAPNFAAGRGYPLAYLLQNFNSEIDYLNGQLTLTYHPIKGMNVKVDGGINNSSTSELVKMPISSLNPTSNSGGQNQIAKYSFKTWILNPQLDYTFKTGKSVFNALVGGTWQKNISSDFYFFGFGYTDDGLLGSTSGAAFSSLGTSSSEYAYESVFGRLTYNYDDEFLLNGTFRRDGSSRFGPDRRFGNFGSVGLGWIFTQQNAVKKLLPFLSFGKLRGSYGINGNDQISDYGYLSYYSAVSPDYQGTTLSPYTLANPDYRWERNRKVNVGLDLGFLNDRIIFNIDVFRNRTDNQLLYYALSPQSGFTGYQANLPAELENQGIELQATSQNIIAKDKHRLGWKTSFNFSVSQNKLLSFPGIESSSYASSYIVGQPVTLIQAYEYTGLNSKGVPVLKDLNGDGSISSIFDRLPVGKNNPLFGGLSNELSWNNFDLSFFWEYTHLEGFNPAYSGGVSGTFNTNQTGFVNDRWTKPGDELITKTSRFSTNSRLFTGRLIGQSTYYYTTTNIFRLRNAQVSYNISGKWMDKTGLRRLRVYAQGQNLWVPGISKHVLDPETGNGRLPALRTFTFGINATF